VFGFFHLRRIELCRFLLISPETGPRPQTLELLGAFWTVPDVILEMPSAAQRSLQHLTVAVAGIYTRGVAAFFWGKMAHAVRKMPALEVLRIAVPGNGKLYRERKTLTTTQVPNPYDFVHPSSTTALHTADWMIDLARLDQFPCLTDVSGWGLASQPANTTHPQIRRLCLSQTILVEHLAYTLHGAFPNLRVSRR
jgi:hypothetical protein